MRYKMIKPDRLYLIINIQTQQVQSSWKRYEDASWTIKDLNSNKRKAARMNLMKLSENEYIVYSITDNLYVTGTKAYAKKILALLGAPKSEIALAFKEMESNGHNYADFGVLRCLTYTCYQEGLFGKKAS